MRAALTQPEVEPYKHLLWLYLSVSGPHLGFLYGTNAVVDTGLMLLKSIGKGERGAGRGGCRYQPKPNRTQCKAKRRGRGWWGQGRWEGGGVLQSNACAFGVKRNGSCLYWGCACNRPMSLSSASALPPPATSPLKPSPSPNPTAAYDVQASACTS